MLDSCREMLSLLAEKSARARSCALTGLSAFLLLNGLASGVWAQVVINEIRIDQPGADIDEYFELAGAAGQSLAGLTYLVIGDGPGGNDGVIEAVVALSGQAIPASGFFVAAEGTFSLGVADLITSLNFENSDNVTHLLVSGFTGASGDDLDANDDGVLDVTPWSAVVDLIALIEEPNPPSLTEFHYGPPTVGPDGSFVPGHAFFCPDGWRIGPFAPGGQDTPGGANACVVPVLELEIFEIQGAGAFSPFEGGTVETVDNVVTAVDTNGFFMQTPTARSDGDENTSDGIFVFTGGEPDVSEGDLVDVTGVVAEFFGLTEIAGGPTVTVTDNGPVPAPVVFDETTPSPVPSPLPDLERFEGMLVRFAGIATGPSDRFGDVGVVVGNDRTFREPGIEFPGLPGLPVWDGNPEVFEIDPNGLGENDESIFATQAVSAEGPLGFAFGDYQVLPTGLDLGREPDVLRPVREREPDEFTVGTLNMFRFFDDINDPPSLDAQGRVRNDRVVSTAEYLRRRAKFADYILDVLDAPDILAVQEVEKLEVLQDLAGDIADLDDSVVYTAFLEEGNDIGTIDVGFLVRDTVQVDVVTQLGKDETFIDPTDGSVDVLHDRPPLLLEGASTSVSGDFPIAVMTVHNRSLGGINDPVDGPRVREKRLQQANSIAQHVQALQDADPDVHLVVIGDFNAFEFTDGLVDVVGRIAGDFVDEDDLVDDPNDFVDPDLRNQIDSLAEEERYSFIFRGDAQAIDHALTSHRLDSFVRGAEYGRGNADAPFDLINDESESLRSSDHDGLVLFVDADDDSDD